MGDWRDDSPEDETTGIDSTRDLGITGAMEIEHDRVAAREEEVEHADPPSIAVPGQRIGRYFVLDSLGKGAMGVVVRAFDPELERTVALKVVNPRFLDRGHADEARARLVSEARAQARLSHPNVTAIYDVGVHGDHVYLAMELVEGSNMAAWLREQRRSWREVVEVFRAAAEGLSAAHCAGLVHRDVKPANILVGNDGRVRLTDFGIARVDTDVITPTPTESDLGPTDLGITEVGFVVGTPAYMSPEQHTGTPVGPEADQYALCVSLYEALYGERPFGGRVQAMIRAKARWEVPEPKDDQVPRWLWSIVRRGLQPMPQKRFESLAALAAALDDDPAKRRRRWLSLVPAGAAVALGVTALVLASTGPSPCADVGSRLEQVWDDTAREQIYAAFEASGRPYAQASFERVVTMLDERAEAWIAMRRDACEATRVRQEQSETLLDRRMACLDQRLDDFGALVDMLREADGQAVDRSLDAVARMRGPGRCADTHALQAEVAPPEAPADRAEAKGIRTVLATARAHRGAGRFDEGLDVVDSARARAEALGYAPVTAEVLLLHASLLDELGRSPEAVAQAKQALWTAQAVGHDEAVAQASVLLVWLSAERQGEPQTGLDWAHYAEATLERMGGDADLRGQLLLYEGAARVNAGQFEAGARAYEAALAHYREHFGDQSPMVPKVMFNMANLELHQGRFERALVGYREALGRLEALHGPDHPRSATAHDHLGTTLLALGRIDEAIEEHGHAIESLGRTLGPDHPDVALSMVNLAHAYEQDQRREAAGRMYQEALRRLEEHPDHPQLPVVLNNIGQHHINAGEPEQALPHIRRALTLFEARLGDDHPNLLNPLTGLARIHTDLGQTDEALAVLRRLHDLAQASFGEDHRMVAVAHADMGNALLQAGRQTEALDRFVAALAVFERNPDSTPTDKSIALNDVASTLLQMDRLDEALPVLERAWQAGEDEGVVPSVRVDSRFNLANGLAAKGEDVPRARRLAEQALEILEEMGADGEAPAAEVREWIAALPAR